MSASMDLLCPVRLCGRRVWVSPEDPDASLSNMLNHFGYRHPELDEIELLAKVREVPSRADS